jgi:hypothetical protein
MLENSVSTMVVCINGTIVNDKYPSWGASQIWFQNFMESIINSSCNVSMFHEFHLLSAVLTYALFLKMLTQENHLQRVWKSFSNSYSRFWDINQILWAHLIWLLNYFIKFSRINCLEDRIRKDGSKDRHF